MMNLDGVRPSRFTAMTDQIVECLNRLEQQEEEQVHLRKQVQLGNVNRKVNWFKRRQALPGMVKEYEKEFRGQALDSYGFLKAAAENELSKNDLSIDNRLTLLNVIKTADKRLKKISTQFYETHPIQTLTVDKEGVSKILLEEKGLLEANIKLYVKQARKNQENLLRVREEIISLEDEINQLANHITPDKSDEERARLQDQLDNKRQGLANKQNEHRKFMELKEVLKIRVEKLAIKLGNNLNAIIKIKDKIEEELKPHPVIEFIREQISDSALSNPAERLLDITPEYKLKHQAEAKLKTDLVGNVFSVARDLVLLKGSKRKILKKGAVRVAQAALIYGGYVLINSFIPSVFAALATAFTAAKSAFIVAGAVIGISNPIGAIIVGVIVSGVTIYALGLLIYKNKARIVKCFTPVSRQYNKLERHLSRFAKAVKNKVSPDLINIQLELRSMPRKGDDHQFRKELGRVAKLAVDQTEIAKIKKDIGGLEKLHHEDLIERHEMNDVHLDRLEEFLTRNIRGFDKRLLKNLRNYDFNYPIYAVKLGAMLMQHVPKSLITPEILETIDAIVGFDPTYTPYKELIISKGMVLEAILEQMKIDKLKNQIEDLREDLRNFITDGTNLRKEEEQLNNDLRGVERALRQRRRTPAEKIELQNQERNLRKQIAEKERDISNFTDDIMGQLYQQITTLEAELNALERARARVNNQPRVSAQRTEPPPSFSNPQVAAS